ncbi:YciI family protein [Kitasatospora sp. NPDC049285]|uniref:YciI family protein n=1 Tax=Kitasatospora sp. NPDC049285 TaxID=3157096 RepID=UPI00344253F5
MPTFLLMVNHDGGVFEQPMDEWAPGDVAAHFDYYEALTRELVASGEMVRFTPLADPRQARIVRSDGASAPVVTDGPFPESKEVLAGFNVVEVESEARAVEIAARISAVPGPGGVPTQQPVEVRRVMTDLAFDL